MLGLGQLESRQEPPKAESNHERLNKERRDRPRISSETPFRDRAYPEDSSREKAYPWQKRFTVRVVAQVAHDCPCPNDRGKERQEYGVIWIMVDRPYSDGGYHDCDTDGVFLIPIVECRS